MLTERTRNTTQNLAVIFVHIRLVQIYFRTNRPC